MTVGPPEWDDPPADVYDQRQPPAEPDPVDPVWDLLQKAPTKAGAKPKRNAYNLGLILRHHPGWADRLRHNAFRDEDEIYEGGWRALTDVDDIDLCGWVSERYRLDYPSTVAREQVLSACARRQAHPVREYLEGLCWDGVSRLDRWLGDCLGVEPSPHAHAVGRAFLVSMVARVFIPGCKVDTVPIFVGKQGARKSSTLAALMPDRSWFADSQIDLQSKDAYQLLRGKWLIEIPEIDQFSSKADASKIKAYVSASTDTYRASYGHRTRDVARQTVFVGTTNAMEFLVDPSGSRRFWLIEAGDCRPEALAGMRDQLWAESLIAYRRGDRWYMSREIDAILAEEADRYRVADVWEPAIREYLDGRIGTVTVSELLVGPIGLALANCDKGSQMRAAAILARLGWHKARAGGPRGWRRD